MVNKSIKNRRSVREYLDKDIDSEIIENLLEAGVSTPTSMDFKAYKIMVIKKGEINQGLLEAFTYKQFHAQTSPYIFFIFSRKPEAITEEYVFSKVNHREKAKKIASWYGPGFNGDLVGGAHTVAYSICLEAYENDLGSCVFTGFDKTKFKEIVKDQIDLSTYEPILGISIGYPVSNENKKRELNIEEKTIWREKGWK